MNKKVKLLLLASAASVLTLSGCGRQGPASSSVESKEPTSSISGSSQGSEEGSQPGQSSEDVSPMPEVEYSAKAKAAAKFVNETYKGADYLEIKELQWKKLKKFYDGLTKKEIATVEPTFAAGTTLRIGAGYNSNKTGISFKNADVTGEGLTLSNGQTYHTGDMKPTWVHLSEKLGITFEDVYGGGSAKNEFTAWEAKLEGVDIVAGTAEQLNAAGAENKLIDFNQHLDMMPNFKAYMDENQIARLSITGNTDTGAIYFSPYFDGVDDIERMPLMRADLVATLLDGSTAYAGANRAVNVSAYKSYMPKAGKYNVDSLNAAGEACVVTKNYNAYGNIIEKMNAVDGLTGDAAVAMLREYIDQTYGGFYEKRSDLFLGKNAAWDVDEMVALLRCAAASLNDNDGNAITPLYCRETGNNQRRVDLFKLAGALFGVRGLESRQDYLYFDGEGALHDARQEAASYDAMERMNAMTQEGLIAVTGTAKSADYLQKDAGIMSYDYNQTQTVMNATKLQEGEKYIAIVNPVARWNDGKTDVYKRFTESWRSVKTEGWAISAAGVEGDNDKLNAALKLLDFAFSVQGQITMSYGPDDFIKVKDASVEVKTWEDVARKYETFNFNGVQMPVIKDETFTELNTLPCAGSYTDYARQYLGSTLNGFPKSQAFEYQCTNEIGKEGSANIAAAIGAGVIDHPELAIVADNMWRTSIPTAFPTIAAQTTALKGLTSLTDGYNQAKDKINIFVNLIATGATGVDGFNY